MDSIKIENLRSLKNTGEVELKPLVVLLGKNSSGKSTFLRTFPLIKQSILTSITEPILWYSEKSVDFGDFETSLNNKSKLEDETISFEFKFKQSQSLERRSSKKNNINVVLRVEVLKKNFKKIVIEAADQKFELLSSKSKEKESDSFILSINDSPLSFKFSQKTSYLFNGNNFLPNIFPQFDKGNIKDKKLGIRRYIDVFSDFIISEIIEIFIKAFGREELGYRVKYAINKKVKEKDKSVVLSTSNINKKQVEEYIDVFHSNIQDFISDTKPALKHLNSISKFKYIDLEKEIATNQNRRFRFVEETGTILEIRNVFLELLESLPVADQFKVNLLLMATYWTDLVNICNDNLFDYFSKVQYIAPVRASAQRYYRFQGLAINEIDPQGENIPMAIKNMPRNEAKNFREWTKENFEFEFFTNDNGGHISLQIKFKNGDVMNLTDTGFGFSQVLPIILLIWRANNNSADERKYEKLNFFEKNKYPTTIVIEQPELHLHPHLQAKLCEVIIKCINLNKDTDIRNTTRIILETHSETIINKIGQLIYENEITNEEVNVLAFGIQDNEKDYSIKKMPFNDEGLFIEWPTDFFMEDF